MSDPHALESALAGLGGTLADIAKTAADAAASHAGDAADIILGVMRIDAIGDIALGLALAFAVRFGWRTLVRGLWAPSCRDNDDVLGLSVVSAVCGALFAGFLVALCLDPETLLQSILPKAAFAAKALKAVLPI